MNRSLSVRQQEEQLIDCTLRCSPGPVSMVDSAAAREGSDSNSIIWSGAVAGPSVAVAAAGTGAGAASTSNEPHPSVRYKGVMLQHNGHWGAQIYAHGDRIWLGTFKSEHAAAAAYDSAAIKLHHSEHTHRNVPASPLTAHEYKFQETLTTEQVLDMIKTGSYESRLEEFIRQSAIETTGDAAAKAAAAASAPNAGGNVTFLEMFVKELTPSDVGKLNRLVIPKKHATQYFPQVSSDSTDEVLVEFVDRENRPWTFRYCYWKSSQSYVFTKGWNKFVKEKRLEAKDSVAFYRCEERDVRRRRYCMIDIIRRHNDGGREASGGFSWSKSGAMGLGLSFKRRNLEQEQSKISGVMGAVQLGLSFKRKMEEDEEGEVVSGPAAAAPLPQKPVMDLVLDHHNNANNKKLKLFGEWII